MVLVVKNLPANARNISDAGLILDREDVLEEEMATHSSILAWRTPWTVAHQASLSMGFPRQEYWNELPFPPPGNLLGPGIKPTSPADSITAEPPGKP